MTSATLAKAPANSEIQLTLKGKQLHYEYDLSGLFDGALWKILDQSPTNEISVDVQLVDGKGVTRVTQHHWFELTHMKNRAIQMTSALGQARTFRNRRAMLASFKKVRGATIKEGEFSGDSGYLEIVAMVNPVQVYSYHSKSERPGKATLIAQTHHDGRLQIRSAAMPQ